MASNKEMQILACMICAYLVSLLGLMLCFLTVKIHRGIKQFITKLYNRE